jgi:hypothetical protein
MDTYNKEGEIIQKGGKCIDQVKFTLISAGLSVLTDILIMLIPAAMIWNLQMPRRKKIAVWAVLSLGWVYVEPSVSHIPRTRLTRPQSHDHWHNSDRAVLLPPTT